MNSINRGDVEYLLCGEPKQMPSFKILSNYLHVLNFCLIIMFLESWVEFFFSRPSHILKAMGEIWLWHKGEHLPRQETHTLPIYFHVNKPCQTLGFLLNKERANYKDYYSLESFTIFPPSSSVSNAEEVCTLAGNDSISYHTGVLFIRQTWY